MKVLEIYDFDREGKERYKETRFYEGEDEYIGRSHTFSYLNMRDAFKNSNKIMGLENEM